MLAKVYGGIADLPADQVQGMTDHEKHIFLAAWNSAHEQYGDEGKAFATAHAAVKRSRKAQLGPISYLTVDPRTLLKYSPDQLRDDHGRFADGASGHNWMNDWADANPPGTVAEREAISTTFDGYRDGLYRDINGYLRLGPGDYDTVLRQYSLKAPELGLGDPETFMQTQRQKVVDQVAAIDKAMQPTPSAVTVWRGVKNPTAARVADNVGVGSVIRDPGYTSTSRDAGTAAFFASQNQPRTLYRIAVPKGTPSVWVDGVERELVLSRGGRYKVTGISLNQTLQFSHSESPGWRIIDIRRMR